MGHTRGPIFLERAPSSLGTAPKARGRRELHDLLQAEFAEIVGVGLLEPDSPEMTLRPEFSFGGMSSGFVSLETWRTSLMRVELRDPLQRLSPSRSSSTIQVAQSTCLACRPSSP